MESSFHPAQPEVSPFEELLIFATQRWCSGDIFNIKSIWSLLENSWIGKHSFSRIPVYWMFGSNLLSLRKASSFDSPKAWGDMDRGLRGNGQDPECLTSPDQTFRPCGLIFMDLLKPIKVTHLLHKRKSIIFNQKYMPGIRNKKWHLQKCVSALGSFIHIRTKFTLTSYGWHCTVAHRPDFPFSQQSLPRALRLIYQ